MPSDHARARKAQKAAARKGKARAEESRDSIASSDAGSAAAATAALAELSIDEGATGCASFAEEQQKSEMDKAVAQAMSPRTAIGALVSLPGSLDIHIHEFSLQYYGRELIADAFLELNHKRRYGLIGPNGDGKSTLLAAIGAREVPIPEHIDLYYLDREAPATDRTALQFITDEIEAELARLEREAAAVLEESGPESETLLELYERMDEMDYDKAVKRAAEILHGLGFTREMQDKPTRAYSGGWRMRIALSRALFLSPSLLLLDEPTNHLDLEACVWLEEHLKHYKGCLVIISHSQDFLNGVCTNIIHLQERQLRYYGGNYDQYVQTRRNLEENQMKQYAWEQEQIAHMKEYIARFGHGSAKLARQAQSKEKTLKKMVEGGLTEKVKADVQLSLRLTPCGSLPPPVLSFTDVSFGYGGQGDLYRHLDLSIDCSSRVALVGRNGTGKSTLLKLMCQELVPREGSIRANSHLRIARYHQHLADQLEMDKSPVQFMMDAFPDALKDVQDARTQVGRFGITGKTQVLPIRQLSDGQRARVVFAWIANTTPHLLLLDEPTNHLDIETIDALASAINSWDGGMVLVSHDFRLISQVASEIWECKGGAIVKWAGDIASYKQHLRQSMALE